MADLRHFLPKMVGFGVKQTASWQGYGKLAIALYANVKGPHQRAYEGWIMDA